MQVDFYHLSASPIERVLPQIAERVLAAEGRLLIVAGDEDLLATLDAALWSYQPEAFLPHGRDDVARQPVLLASLPEPANGARNVALVDGVWREEALTFNRAFHLFDDGAIAAARLAWKALASRDGVERNFWKQDGGGKWIKAA